MEDLYAKFYPIAVRLLGKYGAPATLTRSIPASTTSAAKFNPQLRVPAISAPTSTTALLGPEQIADDQGRPISAMVATMLDEPRHGDTLAIGDRVYSVGDVTIIPPQGKAIIYKAVVTS